MDRPRTFVVAALKRRFGVSASKESEAFHILIV